MCQVRKAKLMFLSNFSNCIVLKSKVNKRNFGDGKLCKAVISTGYRSGRGGIEHLI